MALNAVQRFQQQMIDSRARQESDALKSRSALGDILQERLQGGESRGGTGALAGRSPTVQPQTFQTAPPPPQLGTQDLGIRGGRGIAASILSGLTQGEPISDGGEQPAQRGGAPGATTGQRPSGTLPGQRVIAPGRSEDIVSGKAAIIPDLVQLIGQVTGVEALSEFGRRRTKPTVTRNMEEFKRVSDGIAGALFVGQQTGDQAPTGEMLSLVIGQFRENPEFLRDAVFAGQREFQNQQNRLQLTKPMRDQDRATQLGIPLADAAQINTLYQKGEIQKAQALQDEIAPGGTIAARKGIAEIERLEAAKSAQLASARNSRFLGSQNKLQLDEMKRQQAAVTGDMIAFPGRFGTDLGAMIDVQGGGARPSNFSQRSPSSKRILAEQILLPDGKVNPNSLVYADFQAARAKEGVAVIANVPIAGAEPQATVFDWFPESEGQTHNLKYVPYSVTNKLTQEALNSQDPGREAFSRLEAMSVGRYFTSIDEYRQTFGGQLSNLTSEELAEAFEGGQGAFLYMHEINREDINAEMSWGVQNHFEYAKEIGSDLEFRDPMNMPRGNNPGPAPDAQDLINRATQQQELEGSEASQAGQRARGIAGQAARNLSGELQTTGLEAIQGVLDVGEAATEVPGQVGRGALTGADFLSSILTGQPSDIGAGRAERSAEIEARNQSFQETLRSSQAVVDKRKAQFLDLIRSTGGE